MAKTLCIVSWDGIPLGEFQIILNPLYQCSFVHIFLYSPSDCGLYYCFSLSPARIALHHTDSRCITPSSSQSCKLYPAEPDTWNVHISSVSLRFFPQEGLLLPNYLKPPAVPPQEYPLFQQWHKRWRFPIKSVSKDLISSRCVYSMAMESVQKTLASLME